MSIPSVGLGTAWRREIVALLLWLALWGLTGLLLGYALAALLIGMSLYLALHLASAYQLHRWLRSDQRMPPEGLGIWQEIFLEFYRLKQRNSKRKKRLKNILSEFQASTAALPDGAVVIDSQGRIVWFNQAAAALLGLRSAQDVGQRVVNLVRHPRFAEYLATHGAEGSEVEVPSSVSDDVILSLRIIPYGNEQRLLIARDISHQKQLEATRRDFVANASHELRTPLTVLRGYLEMMEEEIGETGALRRWKGPIGEMGQQAARMGRIIENLLKLARVEAEGLQQRQEVVDVPAMIRRLVADAQRTDQKDLHFATDIDESLCLFGRSGELESVFANLIGNAAQYTPAEGDIDVRWWRDDNGVYFEVSDSGIGIEAKHIPRLTERFYRVDAGRHASSGGTGLGLAIVKHCLEHHEAELDIASEPNTGSTFTCRFPAQRAQARQAA
ncbi:phosphate regulon histidine protein kinase PhoR [Salinisphaera sp. PC39]|uniref:phosphate regulon sensor histidine kinase PhoR n=1 Tax=Salinisphaera sp. PC39 TaxID=1304156 RepID=UPI003340C5C0